MSNGPVAAMLLNALVGLLAAAACVSCEPQVEPKHQQRKWPGTGTIRCTFARPLSECKLRVSDHYHTDTDTVLDFSLGPLAAAVRLPRATARYAGSSLSAGHCGVELTLTNDDAFLVECFGRDEHGAWDRGVGTLAAYFWDVLAVTTATPRLAVARPGSSLAVLFKAQVALARCYVKTPAAREVDLSPGMSLPSGSRYRPHGAGAASGECGAELTDLQQADAGVWWWRGWKNSPHVAAWLMSVVAVQAAPHGDPELQLATPGGLRAGYLLNATCRAPPSVPAAQLTWLLDGQVVQSSTWNNTLDKEVAISWPWQLQPAMQTFTRLLTEADAAKTLTCQMTHPGLDAPKVARLVIATLNVRVEKAVVRSAEGHSSELACNVDSVSEATVRWSRGEVPVVESSYVLTGTDGARHWLQLEDITATDLTLYTCKATSAAGSATGVVTLTGLPGKPEWAGATAGSTLAWSVESHAPITGIRLKVRRGRGALKEVAVSLVPARINDTVVLVTHEFLAAVVGEHSASLEVTNKYGTARSAIHRFAATPTTTPTKTSTTTPKPTTTPTPLIVRAENAVVQSDVGYESEMACIVIANPEATVRWSRGGVPVKESSYVVTGIDGARHWLRLEDTAADDLTDFTCTATNAVGSASSVVTLSGLPGKPEWAGDTAGSALAWIVTSHAPITGAKLKIRQGKYAYQEVTLAADATARINASSVTIHHVFAAKVAGDHSAHLAVTNKYGTARSDIQHFTATLPVAASSTVKPVAPTLASSTVDPTPTTEIVVGPDPCGEVTAIEPRNNDGSVFEGLLPWHAGIYKMEGGDLEQQCAGTLVSARLVVTAAHCFYDEAAHALHPLRLYRVKLGSVQRTWDADLRDGDVQHINVAAVNVTEFYAGADFNYHHDIAVVRLEHEAVFTIWVHPACLDWKRAYDVLPPATLATTAGWNGTSVLRWKELEVVGTSRCRQVLRGLNKMSLLTPDKLCAGVNGSAVSVCRGDSGGGLVLRAAATQRHFLVGVAGVGFENQHGAATPTCHAESFASYTRISQHAAWLRGFF